MKQLFGTDGIRGKAYEYPMTPAMAEKIGRAVAFFNQDNAKIVIGRDTRESGPVLEKTLTEGLCSMGADVYLTGILPTPGIALLTSHLNAGAGIVISASHNPYYDNGIKIFQTNGSKLSDHDESGIENLLLNKTDLINKNQLNIIGKTYHIKDAANLYSDFLKSTISAGISLKGIKIVLDCANGATTTVAPKVYKELGATVESLFKSPNGQNINDNCGSQYPDLLASKVIELKADIGLAFDGDGDRLIAVDEKGEVLSGDQILAICAAFLKKQGNLKNNIVVSTIMSNLGLSAALKKLDITHIRSNVGDRHVYKEMKRHNAVIGGEDSGHMIFLDYHTTGDGIIAGLQLLEVMLTENKPLSELKKIMTVFPQELINVNIKNKLDINTIPEIINAVHEVEDKLQDKGRVLIRYSGTQPLCRVMVEGPTEDETRQYCKQISEIVKAKLG